MWAVPWSTDATVNALFLAVAALIVVAVPMVYGSFANLRDPLARALLAGTGGTALAFSLTLAAMIAVHAGWSPPEDTWNWLARLTYAAVAVGKATLLVALIMERKRARRLATFVAAEVAADRAADDARRNLS